MNAVESLVRTGVFPSVCTHSHAVFTVASEARIVCTTSTSFMSGTGLKKCRPRTWPGRRVAAASAVTLHDEVLVARIACGGQIVSRRAKVSFLSVGLGDRLDDQVARLQLLEPGRAGEPAERLVARLLVDPG